jgi:hypothetical protein
MPETIIHIGFGAFLSQQCQITVYQVRINRRFQISAFQQVKPKPACHLKDIEQKASVNKVYLFAAINYQKKKSSALTYIII